jgi:regulator of RNase E activity RraA
MNAKNELVDSLPIPISEVRRHLSVPLLCDALDSCGYLSQSPRLPIEPRTLQPYFLFGTAKTLLWADMAHVDPKPYELELAAIDSCQPDDVIVCAAGGSMRSGICGQVSWCRWGSGGWCRSRCSENDGVGILRLCSWSVPLR